MDIQTWQREIHAQRTAKGWWDGDRRNNVGELCALIHEEVSEVFKEHRNGRNPTEMYFTTDKRGCQKPEGIPIELADITMWVLDVAEYFGVDLEAMMAVKHAYNFTRPTRDELLAEGKR